jgi:hypothetical protein
LPPRTCTLRRFGRKTVWLHHPMALSTSYAAQKGDDENQFRSVAAIRRANIIYRRIIRASWVLEMTFLRRISTHVSIWNDSVPSFHWSTRTRHFHTWYVQMEQFIMVHYNGLSTNHIFVDGWLGSDLTRTQRNGKVARPMTVTAQ